MALGRPAALAALGVALVLAVIVHYRHTRTTGGLVAPKEVRGSRAKEAQKVEKYSPVIQTDHPSQFSRTQSFSQTRSV